MTKHPAVFLGIDLGTSSLKVLALSEEGHTVRQGQAPIPLTHPRPGWAEQDPEAWWTALCQAIPQALQGLRGRVVALGLSGQMHGTVLTDTEGRPLAPAVIWADRRSEEVLADYRDRLPETALEALHNPIVPGFTGPTLFWVSKHQAELLKRARWVLQPKDWLRFRLTHTIGAEPSDASATLLFEPARGGWSEAVLQALGLDPELLPPLGAPATIAGYLNAQAAQELGLPAGVPVAFGAADQAAAALGNGILNAGQAQIGLGTGGQVLKVYEHPVRPPLGVHLFCHAIPQRWYHLGAILNLGLALHWVQGVLSISWSKLLQLADQAFGAQGPIFLPYLVGERTPYLNPQARAAWIGLTVEHTQVDLARSALEGILLALKEAALAVDLSDVGSIRLAGGILRTRQVPQLLADLLGMSLDIPKSPEASAWGAALLGGLASGDLQSDELPSWTIPSVHRVAPQRQISEAYLERFREAYRKLDDGNRLG